MKTSFSIRIAFFFILSFLAVSCHRDTDALNMTFSKVEKCMDLCPDSALNYNRQIKKFPTEKQNVSLKHILT